MQENTRKTDTDSKTKKLIEFGVKSLNTLKNWEKKARITLQKSRKFTNELKRQARA